MSRPVRHKLVAVVVSLAAAVAACGGTDSDAPPSGPRQWQEADVVRLGGLRRNPDLSYRLAAHPECVTQTLLRSTAEVQTYKDAGDILATNPDRSAGAVIDKDSPPCRRLFRQALARVR
jgi:nitrous oxide reductase accessory protein NosL